MSIGKPLLSTKISISVGKEEEKYQSDTKILTQEENLSEQIKMFELLSIESSLAKYSKFIRIGTEELEESLDHRDQRLYLENEVRLFPLIEKVEHSLKFLMKFRHPYICECYGLTKGDEATDDENKLVVPYYNSGFTDYLNKIDRKDMMKIMKQVVCLVWFLQTKNVFFKKIDPEDFLY